MLTRRIELREADEEDENSSFSECFAGPNPSKLPAVKSFDPNLSTEEWIDLCARELTIADKVGMEAPRDDQQLSPWETANISKQKAALETNGFILGDTFERAVELSTPIHKVRVLS